MNVQDSNEGLIMLTRGEPSGAFGPVRCQYYSGQCLRNPQNREQFLTVVRENSRFVSEDGMSLGIGDHEGWLHTAYCRLATDLEISAYKQLEKMEQSEHETRLATIEAWQHLREILAAQGEQPGSAADPVQLKAREILRDTLANNSGEGFVVDHENYMWYLRGMPAYKNQPAILNASLKGQKASGYRMKLNDVLDALEPREIKLLKIGRYMD